MTINQAISKLEQLKNDLPSLVTNAIMSDKSKVIDLNRSFQLFQKGIDSNGNKLLAYRPTTQFIKRQKNQIFKHTTLKDTGEFYAGFRILIENGFLYITSTDDKTDSLMDKYGKNIFGLTRDNRLTLFGEIINPKLWSYLKSKNL